MKRWLLPALSLCMHNGTTNMYTSVPVLWFIVLEMFISIISLVKVRWFVFDAFYLALHIV